MSGCGGGGGGTSAASDTPTAQAVLPMDVVEPVMRPPERENRPPEISGVPLVAVDAGTTYEFVPQASDVDGDALEFSIDNRPKWASFDSQRGVLSGVPSDADVGESEDITVTVTDGLDARAIGPFRIRVRSRPVGPTMAAGNTAPTIGGVSDASISVGQFYLFQPVANDREGAMLRFLVSNRPAWLTFNTQSGALSGTPTAAQTGLYKDIVISVSDGTSVTSLAPFSIEVQGVNRAPTLAGTPAKTVAAGKSYSFVPSAADPDSDALTFLIDNKPSWATFDKVTGRLSGTPAASNVGSYPGIVIAASDGRRTTSLPAFALTVQAASAAGPANRAPTISGRASAVASVGEAYVFQPAANDPDGDALQFSAQSKPSWLTLDAKSGRLSGTPTSNDVGAFPDIVISASDGKTTVALPAFTINVNVAVLGSATLSWQSPTQNTDGSPLLDLGSYRIRYGTQPKALSRTVEVGADVSTYVLEGLVPATYYFTISAVSTAGIESVMSPGVSKTISASR